MIGTAPNLFDVVRASIWLLLVRKIGFVKAKKITQALDKIDINV